MTLFANPSVMNDRNLWTSCLPRLEVVHTHDLFAQLRHLFDPLDDVLEADIHTKEILSMCFHHWACDNHLSDPYLPHHPPSLAKMEGYRTPSILDRILDGVFWNNVDLLNAMSTCRVKQAQFDPIIYGVLQRLEEFYPPTGYEGLIDVHVSLVRWLRGDMVLALN